MRIQPLKILYVLSGECVTLDLFTSIEAIFYLFFCNSQSNNLYVKMSILHQTFIYNNVFLFYILIHFKNMIIIAST